jgi:two-component system, chemotaxis family, chemotaxis protein CheY
MRILIADDAGFIRDIISEVYLQAGHEIVAEATTGHEAVVYALELKPDLVIMDIVLPEMNGLEATAQITAKDKDINIVTTSSIATEWMQENSKKAGSFYFMKKPFTKDELLRVAEMVNTKLIEKQKAQKLKYG